MRQVGVGGEGMDEEGRVGRMVRMGGVAGGWRRKKYMNETGKWKIFSWKEPTGGKGAFTCTSCAIKCWNITCTSCTVMCWKK